ncbi:signal transducing adapter molecule 1 [Nilaparvata lugens]|uniref:signal transducing adapter molecule 1 n=1 Tax=Nilaparvata lugens TaxID=108931 RepID=UPI00193D3698|nr:signal transducing adapter molecule 1 [Nilaparvata lugens]
MGIFSASPFETDVEKATNEKNVSEEWSVIMEICDKIQESPQNSKEYLRAIFKRLNHQDPHIVMQALSLLDACVNNCGKPFHLEVASREFEAEFKKLVGKSQPKIAEKFKSLLKKWAEGEFKNDTQLTLIPSLYAKLVKEGVDFSHVDESKPKQSPQLKDPNAVSSQKEVEDIAKAIELSLQDTTISSVTKSGPSSSSSLYPSPSMANSNTSTEGRKVRALYDFEAAEENELTFSAGEIIQVLDDTDSSWWEGCNQRGRGLFPSNFVTDDLTVEPENTKFEKKSVQFNETVQVKTVKNLQPVEIDEAKIDRLSYLLHEADPEDDANDSEQMLTLEEEVNAMAPLIDTELERVDKKHAVLTQLSSKLVESLNIYYTLMRDHQFAKQPTLPPPSPFHQSPAPPQGFNGPVTYSLPPEQYMMGPPPPGPQYPSMGPQSLPPNQQMSFPQSGLPEYLPPFPGAHSQHNMAGGFAAPAPTPGPPPTSANSVGAPTNSQQL